MNGNIGKVAAAALVGLALGAAAMWGIFALSDNARVEVVEGTTTGVNEPGTAVGVATEPGGPGKSYGIAGASWREAGGTWHTSGPPTCLEPLTAGQRVRLAVVHVPPLGEAPGREMVAWIECLGR